MLEKEGRKVSLNVAKAQKIGHLLLVAQDLNFDGVDEMFAAVGYGNLTPRRVLNRLYAALHPEDVGQQPPPQGKERREEPRKDGGVDIAGVDGVLTRFAKCCNPVPGDPIIGYISHGMGLSVHRADCPNVPNMEPERLISVHWSGAAEKPYEAGIFVIAKNEHGVLADVTRIFAQNMVNISALELDQLVDGRARLRFTVEVRDAAQLYNLIETIRALPAILEVIRETEGMAT
jgi:GTP pyrophosphokinase